MEGRRIDLLKNIAKGWSCCFTADLSDPWSQNWGGGGDLHLLCWTFFPILPHGQLGVGEENHWSTWCWRCRGLFVCKWTVTCSETCLRSCFGRAVIRMPRVGPQNEDRQRFVRFYTRTCLAVEKWSKILWHNLVCTTEWLFLYFTRQANFLPPWTSPFLQ